MNCQATRNAEPIRIRNLPLWVETTRRARRSDWYAGIIVMAMFVVPVFVP